MADKEIKVTLTLNGIQQFRSQLKSVSQAAQDLKKDFTAFGGAVGNAATQMTRIAAAAVAAVTAVTALTIRNADLNDQVVKLAQATGQSIDELQRLGFIGNQVGVSQETLASSLRKFSIELAKAKTDTTDYKKENEKLKDGQEALNETIRDAERTLSRALGTTNRATIAATGQKNAQSKVAAATQRARDAQERYNETVDKAKRKYADLVEKLNETDEGEGNLVKTLTRTNPKLLEQIKAAKNNAEAFKIYIAALRETKDVNEQNLLTSVAFGKANLEMANIARISAQEFSSLSDQADRLGIVLGKDVLDNSVILHDVVDALHDSFGALSRALTGTLQPALIIAGNALLKFIEENRKQILDFANKTVSQATEVVVGFFKLLATGGQATDVTATSRKIFDAFVSIKDSAISAFTAVKNIAGIIDTFAKTLGFASGQQLTFILIGLKFTGLLNVITTGLNLVLGVGKLFVANLGLIGPALTLLSGPAGVWLAAITAISTAIFFIIEQTIGWDKVNQAIKDFFNFLVEFAPFALQGVIDLILQFSESVLNFFLQIPQFITNALGPEVLASLNTMWEQAKIDATAIVVTLNEILSGIFNSTVVQTMISGFTFLFTFLRENFTTIAATAAQLFISGFSNIISTITDFIGQAIAIIVSFLTGDIERIKATFSNLIDSLLAKAHALDSAIGTVASGIKDFFTPAAPTPSPPLFGPGFAGGGAVRGAGTSTSDSILARLSRGEFVVKTDSVKKYGLGFMHAINNGLLNLKGYATGGLADLSSSLSSSSGPAFQPAFANNPSGQSGGRPFNLILPNGKMIRTKGIDDSVARELQKELRSSANAKAMDLPDWY